MHTSTGSSVRTSIHTSGTSIRPAIRASTRLAIGRGQVGVATAIACLAVLTACTSSPHPQARKLIASPSSSAGFSLPTGPVVVPFDPNGFVTVIDNRYYPLKPGMKWVYQGVRDGVTQRDEVTVSDRTKVIDGVTATVVTDIATANGKLLEKTEDWFAQDKQGNVWYLGEDTASYDNGTVDTSGSWTAGIDGGQPGIIMPSQPQVTDSYRQEYLRGEAEDTSWVVQTSQTVTEPYGKLSDVIRTLEFSGLEPDVVDTKYYAPGIGIVREASLAGPKETADLISFTNS